MKLVLISDTHTQHKKLGKLPEGDVLIHAGDYTYRGGWEEKRSFYQWFLHQPHPYKILVAGNHDFGEPVIPKELEKNTFYLFDSEVKIDGLTFWGSPFTPRFGKWAFMYDRPTNRWESIPYGVDVLITHGPPKGIFDQPFGKGEHVGCFDLATRVGKVQPKVHVFGHIHGSAGSSSGLTHFVNASVVNESYEVVNPPVVVEI